MNPAPGEQRHCCLLARGLSLPPPLCSATADRHHSRPRLSLREASLWRLRRPATWALCWLAGLCSTGDLTMGVTAVSVAQLPASARAAPSCMWWPHRHWCCIWNLGTSSFHWHISFHVLHINEAPGEQQALREGRALSVQQQLIPHSEPPGGVELRLAPVLALLQQRLHSGAQILSEPRTPLGKVQRRGSGGGGDAGHGRRRRACSLSPG